MWVCWRAATSCAILDGAYIDINLCLSKIEVSKFVLLLALLTMVFREISCVVLQRIACYIPI